MQRLWTYVTRTALLVAALTLSACSTVRPASGPTVAHRFFLELDRPGLTIAALHSPDNPGAFVRILEIDAARRPVGDTLTAWVQHYDGIKALSPHAHEADLVIACFREYLPERVRTKHVLPGSTGTIYVYLMRGGILAVTDEKVPFYEVLVMPGGSVAAPVPQQAAMTTAE